MHYEKKSIKIYQNIGRNNVVFPKLLLWLVPIVPMQLTTYRENVCDYIALINIQSDSLYMQN